MIARIPAYRKATQKSRSRGAGYGVAIGALCFIAMWLTYICGAIAVYAGALRIIAGAGIVLRAGPTPPWARGLDFLAPFSLQPIEIAAPSWARQLAAAMLSPWWLGAVIVIIILAAGVNWRRRIDDPGSATLGAAAFLLFAPFWFRERGCIHGWCSCPSSPF